jgi:hypothetical protein
MNKNNDYSIVLKDVLNHATDFLNKLDHDNVCATKSLEKLREDLKKPLKSKGELAEGVINELVKDVDGGLLGSTGGTCCGLVDIYMGLECSLICMFSC